MASQFTLLKDIDPSSENQVYKIKVRLIKSWSLTYSELKYQKPMIELVVMDEMGDRIQCTIRNPLRRLFEGDLSDGKVYIISNFSLSLNDQKYKPTTHSHRIYFKRETQIRIVDEPGFIDHSFHFVSNELILKHSNPQSHLIDVIGLITGKGDTIEFTRNGKSCVYIVVELDDMKCTLWEEYAKMLVKHIEDQPTSEYIIIIQFAKFNLFKGSMGVCNTNCNSILYINADFPEVKDFRKSVIMIGVPPANQLSQLSDGPSYSLEDDLINQTNFKNICDLKESSENGTYVTYGTVVAIDYKSGWWYKSCKHCFHALKESENSFHCVTCDTFPNSHVPRFSINLRVADELDTASFILYDKEASKYLGVSASDMRLSHVNKGGLKDEYPQELNAFIGKNFIFKISVKMEDINAFQPCRIVVLKLCADNSIISKFLDKHKIYNENLVHENSELITILSDSTETPKQTGSPSIEIIGDDNTESFSTPKRGLIEAASCTKSLFDVYPDSENQSSTKSRKIIVEEVHNIAKLHEE
ncbi:uncharacterized protein LOC130939273 [Arachis stenosperma]|uniref:uncharacterized protein LOC130939273 n=1 Tax=Arachis stenosperma TaxID=217475 RepID=UPI0025AC8921|nr:uncharacterized protein LOC130939273 [Arachis stenosperma]